MGKHFRALRPKNRKSGSYNKSGYRLSKLSLESVRDIYYNKRVITLSANKMQLTYQYNYFPTI